LVTKFQRKDYLPPCFRQGVAQKAMLLDSEFSDKQHADLAEALLGAAFLVPGPKGAFAGTLSVLKWFGSEVEKLPYVHDYLENKSIGMLLRHNICAHLIFLVFLE